MHLFPCADRYILSHMRSVKTAAEVSPPKKELDAQTVVFVGDTTGMGAVAALSYGDHAVCIVQPGSTADVAHIMQRLELYQRTWEDGSTYAQVIAGQAAALQPLTESEKEGILELFLAVVPR